MQVCAAAAASVSSRVLQTGKRALSATGGARSDRGRGEVSATSNRGGERRDSVFSTPDPAHFRRLSSIRRETFGRARQSSQPRISVVRDVRAVLGRARGNVHLQKSHRRARPSGASRTASARGSSRCSRTSMNTCGECSAGQRGRSSTRTARKGGPCWSRAMEGTSAPGKAFALTCGGWNGATRLENRALRAPFPGASERCQRVDFGGATAS